MFAQKLKQAMKELGLKQVQVATLTGKTKSSISEYVAGNVIPPKSVQKQIAVSLGLSEDYFVDEFLETLKRHTVPQITPENVARMLGVSPQTIRKGLQQKVFPWGYAIQTSDRWRYIINAKKFAEVEGITLPETMIF